MMGDRFVQQQGTYLLSHSVGLPLRDAEQRAAEAFWHPWQAGNADIWQHWLQEINVFRGELAQLFNGDMDFFCPQSSLSSAVSKIVISLSLPTQKTTILLSEEDFPSIAFALQKTDLPLKFIPAAEDTTDLTVWARHMSPDIGLVLVTHVQSNNGRQLPVTEITQLSRDKGILSLIDVAQSAGILPIDLCQWSADFVVGSCVKWIGGGPGAAFMWVAPSVVERCQPKTVGWFSHENPFEFDIHHFAYAPDALKFWGGTPSVYPFVVAANSLKFINQIGIKAIREHNLRLSDKIIQATNGGELVSPRSAAQRSGTVILQFSGRQASVLSALHEQQIHVDSRAKGIRLSPHLCNSAEQIDALIKHIF